MSKFIRLHKFAQDGIYTTVRPSSVKLAYKMAQAGHPKDLKLILFRLNADLRNFERTN
ncbi:MAG: hypothetical protein ISR65_14665 [Bacteriovoracaceae bacterium]|nr:hypothetical protein [Bacteriovoracaceae bacterium]